MKFTLAAGLLLICAMSASAEQKQSFGVYDAHYIVIPTAMLKPEIAAQYGIVRSPTQALVNISLIERDGLPVASEVSGSYRNLLEQTQTLTFREVREGAAIYYLATFRYTDRDVLRFTFNIRLPDGGQGVIEHQQRMHREDT
jgi:hypothetical protein